MPKPLTAIVVLATMSITEVTGAGDQDSDNDIPDTVPPATIVSRADNESNGPAREPLTS